MPIETRRREEFAGAVLLSVALLATPLAAGAATRNLPAGFQERSAEVNGTRIHYLIGGSGSAVVLLHGFAETGHMWLPILPLLARRHTVVVPDLRGAGDSARPVAGYEKTNMAVDIHELTTSLGLDPVTIVGHDIGLMVAYAYAAQFPRSASRVVLMDAFLPGVGDWKSVWLLGDLWHFHFFGPVPLALVKGRERTYLEHFWNDFAADPKHSVPEADRRLYAEALARPGGVQAGFSYFKAFPQDAVDFERLSRTRLLMPMLILSGEKGSGEFLVEQGRMVATDVKGVLVAGSGHWLLEEAPDQVVPLLVAFIDGTDGAK
jgi:pimeloyl-ACP methyl ester carboxylesterase